MKIIFLNTWHSELRDELRAYVAKHRESTVAFCFQEALPEERSVYEDVLADFIPYSAEKHIREGLEYANVIYVRKDIEVSNIASLFRDDMSENDPGLALYATLTIGETSLTICNVHGAPYPGDKLDSPARLLQTKTILDTFAGQEPVIIGGDFNLLPDTHSIRMFSEHGYQDLIHNYAIPTTRNYISHEKYPDNIQLYADFAFASPDILVNNFVVPSAVVSDHQPLELDVSLGLNNLLGELETQADAEIVA